MSDLTRRVLEADQNTRHPPTADWDNFAAALTAALAARIRDAHAEAEKDAATRIRDALNSVD